MDKKKPNDGEVLPNSEPQKTKVLAFHLYSNHHEEFLSLCEKLGVFHSEVLRKLVIQWIKEQKAELEETQPPFVIDTKTGKLERQHRIL